MLGLLDVLDLFADALKFFFHFDGQMRYLGIVGFRTDRVYFPVNLLDQEIQLPPNGLAGFERFSK